MAKETWRGDDSKNWELEGGLQLTQQTRESWTRPKAKKAIETSCFPRGPLETWMFKLQDPQKAGKHEDYLEDL